eukprot:scaffold137792_cov14-Tisochrysis_lutea.AAC.1
MPIFFPVLEKVRQEAGNVPAKDDPEYTEEPTPATSLEDIMAFFGPHITVWSTEAREWTALSCTSTYGPQPRQCIPEDHGRRHLAFLLQ